MSNKHIGHGVDEIAYHVEWEFRREALLWRNGVAVGVNLHPIATEFRQWLLGEGSFSVFAEEHRKKDFAYSNPYTYGSSVLSSILASVINDSHAFANTTDVIDAMDADIQRIRIHSEQVLYVARICEALIKQLLYCTQIDKKSYEKTALGGLLSTECRGCKNSGAKRHKLSLLGSLAHRYHLCLPFEHCLFEHLKIIARKRNIEAAHSGAQIPKIRSSADSRQQLKVDSREVGNELVHMLNHISDLEEHMIGELTSLIVAKRSIAFKRSGLGTA